MDVDDDLVKGDALERDAASTLVQISRRASFSRIHSTSNASKATGATSEPVSPLLNGGGMARVEMQVQVQTPSSILGLL
jgi:hypothetical protein